ncbi:hypothetical protein [Cellulomonas denverensis]|uniref:hypothetical protein n=1 Tax=Cellulomonas denverensis TaxID=264297 RepID=UPI0035E89B58
MSGLAVAHGALLQVWAEVSPSPSPSVTEIPPEDQTSPGLLGFLVTFAAALAVMGLAYSMVRKMRKVERRGRQLEEEEAAAAAAEQVGTTAPTAPDTTPESEGR